MFECASWRAFASSSVVEMYSGKNPPLWKTGNFSGPVAPKSTERWICVTSGPRQHSLSAWAQRTFGIHKWQSHVIGCSWFKFLNQDWSNWDRPVRPTPKESAFHQVVLFEKEATKTINCNDPPRRRPATKLDTTLCEIIAKTLCLWRATRCLLSQEAGQSRVKLAIQNSFTSVGKGSYREV